jgi:hypothetical protein
MKRMKPLLFLALVVIIVGGIARVITAKRQASRGAASQTSTAAKAELAQPRNEAQPTAPPTVGPVAPATPGKSPAVAAGRSKRTDEQHSAAGSGSGQPNRTSS